MSSDVIHQLSEPYTVGLDCLAWTLCFFFLTTTIPDCWRKRIRNRTLPLQHAGLDINVVRHRLYLHWKHHAVNEHWEATIRSIHYWSLHYIQGTAVVWLRAIYTWSSVDLGVVGNEPGRAACRQPLLDLAVPVHNTSHCM